MLLGYSGEMFQAIEYLSLELEGQLGAADANV